MPTYSTTARRGLRKLLGTNKVKDIDAGIGALADDVDALLLVRSFGKAIIPGAETRSGVVGYMTTPDRVTGLVLPTDGLIVVGYQATWQESAVNGARATLYLGANEVYSSNLGIGSPTHYPAYINETANRDYPLASTAAGLASNNGATGAPPAYTGDVTTGQAIGIAGANNPIAGGLCTIFAAAGTYDIGVQFATSSGNVTVRNRRLWAWTLGF